MCIRSEFRYFQLRRDPGKRDGDLVTVSCQTSDYSSLQHRGCQDDVSLSGSTALPDMFSSSSPCSTLFSSTGKSEKIPVFPSESCNTSPSSASSVTKTMTFPVSWAPEKPPRKHALNNSGKLDREEDERHVICIKISQEQEEVGLYCPNIPSHRHDSFPSPSPPPPPSLISTSMSSRLSEDLPEPPSPVLLDTLEPLAAAVTNIHIDSDTVSVAPTRWSDHVLQLRDEAGREDEDLGLGQAVPPPSCGAGVETGNNSHGPKCATPDSCYDEFDTFDGCYDLEFEADNEVSEYRSSSLTRQVARTSCHGSEELLRQLDALHTRRREEHALCRNGF